MKKILTTLCLCLGFSSISFADVAVIVHVDNKSTLSDSDISRLFLGKMKKFPLGDNAVPMNLKIGGVTRNEFDKKVLNKSASQVKAYWSKMLFSGKGKPPPELVSDKDALAAVASDTNIIAYVDAASVDETVKVIKVF
jgi:ABC-type phosphate transport system substrate-binding protein